MVLKATISSHPGGQAVERVTDAGTVPVLFDRDDLHADVLQSSECHHDPASVRTKRTAWLPCGPRHGLACRVAGGRGQGRTVEELAGHVVEEPVLAGFEAPDDQVTGGCGGGRWRAGWASCRSNGDAHLREIFGAVRAAGQVPLETLAVAAAERAFQVVGHQLDRLLADKVCSPGRRSGHCRQGQGQRALRSEMIHNRASRDAAEPAGRVGAKWPARR